MAHANPVVRLFLLQAPATVLSKQILPNGDVEILVPFDETFLLDGERVAFVTFYQCVRTSISGGRMTQRRERCLPRVEILPPPPTVVINLIRFVTQMGDLLTKCTVLEEE